MPDCSKLLQECPTRFETTFDVVQRFLSSITLVDGVINRTSDEYGSAVQAKKIFSQIYRECAKGKIVYPGLRAALDVFALLQHSQTLLEASNKSKITSVLPIL